MSNKQTTLGFLAGAALGGFAALLLAPSSGARTRRRIRHRARQVGEETRERIAHTGERIKVGALEKKATVQDGLEQTLDAVRRNAAALSEAANEGYHAYRERLEETDRDGR